MRPLIFSRSETMLGSGKITPAGRKFFAATILTDSLSCAAILAESLRRSVPERDRSGHCEGRPQVPEFLKDISALI
jgi:hypothetical protein